MQLLEIQKLQFSNKPEAELQLLKFLKENEDPEISKVELTPRPESLNSINGFITYSNGERVFFKTHVEENEQISEYYNAQSLAAAGYPIVAAKQIQHRPGKQIALYEILTYPTLFDKLKTAEDGILDGRVGTVSSGSLGSGSLSSGSVSSGSVGSSVNELEDGAGINFDSQVAAKSNGEGSSSQESLQIETFTESQIELEKRVFSIYEQTLEIRPQRDQFKAPINQLFSHRLKSDGRLGLFYRNKTISLGKQDIVFEDLANCTWTINGVEYLDTLAKIISRSDEMLTPENKPNLLTATVVGHGDAHNGNIFLVGERNELRMFDPAFAGRHNVLLDLTKPLFHNIFARWMYFPEQVSKEIELTVSKTGDKISIKHNFHPSELRLKHLAAKRQHLLIPTLRLLESKGRLPVDWIDYLRSALFCCPFLTVNLFANYKENGTLAERYPNSIKWLGLSIAVELGSKSHTGSSDLSKIVADIFERTE